MNRSRLIHERRLAHVPQRMRIAFTSRWLSTLRQRHLRDGMPQLAVFAFDHVGQAIALWGRYERDELDLLMAALAPHLVDGGGGVCLDIGANIGNHALFFADRFREVLAFEPNPRTFGLLQFNAALRRNIACFNLGLSDADGPARMTVPTDNIGMATLHASGGLSGAAVDCELRRLDGLDVLAQRRVAMVKIDVEGHEPAVLRGASALLARDRPVVVFEQTPRDIHDGTSPAIELLRHAGYARFWTIEHHPASRWHGLNVLRRVLFGERLRMVECDHFEARFHSMIVALPSAAQ